MMKCRFHSVPLGTEENDSILAARCIILKDQQQ
jgi:hypothetical protein